MWRSTSVRSYSRPVTTSQDANRQLLSKHVEHSFHDMIGAAAPFRPPPSPSKTQLAKAADAADRQLMGIVQQLLLLFAAIGYRKTQWEVDFGVLPAATLALPLEEAREQLAARHEAHVEQVSAWFEQSLTEAADAQFIGDITWLDERHTSCTLRYFERSRTRTLTKIRTHVDECVHNLVNVRQVRLPAQRVPMPRRCRRIIDALPAFMVKHGHIVTGTLINPQQCEGALLEDDNELVHAGKWLRRVAESAVATGARAAATAGSAVATKSRAMRETKLMRGIFEDPGLLLGRHILFGWKE